MAYPPTVYQPPPAEASARGPRGFTARWRACGSRCYNCGKSGGEAFFRVKIDAQFSEAGWDMLDGRSVRYESALLEGTSARIKNQSAAKAGPMIQ
ncbi:MAG: hypothetical protein V3R74_09905 [Alphaproteobacteria bacterium]